MEEETRSSYYATQGQRDKLAALAAELGFHHTRGVGKSMNIGNISTLMQAIADADPKPLADALRKAGVTAD